MTIEVLQPWNTHWRTGQVSPLIRKDPRPRVQVPHMIRELVEAPQDLWVLRPGPRQIGKTTSLGHVMAGLIDDHHVDPLRIVFAPVDQDDVQRAFAGQLARLFDAVRALAAPTREKPAYLLIDEIQALPDWAQHLKAAWDRNHLEFRVVATGSSALRLLRPAAADFPGRVRTVRMFPMKFREVAAVHPERSAHIDEAAWDAIVRAAKNARSALIGPRVQILERIADLAAATVTSTTSQSFLLGLFTDYCMWGGYPKARPGSDLDAAARLEFFGNVWNSIVAKDLAGTADQPEAMGRMFRWLATSSGGKFVPQSIAKDLELSRTTVYAWSRILEDLMVIQPLPPVKPNLRYHKGRHKMHLVDPGWAAYWNRVTQTHSAEMAPEQLGHLVETVLVDHARRLGHNILGTDANIAYVHEPEVDIALHLGARWLLIESKFSSSRGARLGAVGTEDDLRIVATRDALDLSRADELKVPAHLLALMA